MVGLHFIYPSELQHFMLSYDAIRLFAVVAIVVLHTAANGVNRLAFASADWWLANLADSAARAGVPLFLMLTGALFLHRRGEPARQFYQRRWQRLALPLLLWSLFYLLWSALKAQVKQQPYQLADAAYALLSGAPYFHLWFIFMLAGVYLVLPAIRSGWQTLTRPQQLQLTLACLLLQQSVHLAAVSSGFWPDIPWPLWFIAYLPYLLLGALLANPSGQNKAQTALPRSAETAVPPADQLTSPTAGVMWRFGQLSAFILLTCSTAGLYYLQHQPVSFSTHAGSQLPVLATAANWLHEAPVSYAYHRLSLPVLLLALVLWFLLGHSKQLTRSANSRVGQLLLRHSLTIYCLHPVFLDITTMVLQRLPSVKLPYSVLLVGQVSLIMAGCVLCCLQWDRLTQWWQKRFAAAK